MESRYFRIAYAVQYVVTLIAIFAVWAQVGGQYHLDLMPWHWKLLAACALSLATVKATAAAVRCDKLRNAGSMGWLAVALGLIVTMGILSYYEHLHEPAEEDEEAPASRVDISYAPLPVLAASLGGKPALRPTAGQCEREARKSAGSPAILPAPHSCPKPGWFYCVIKNSDCR